MKRNIIVRKSFVWKASYRLERFWKSILPWNIKVNLFCSTVEYVLLYGCVAWTLKKKKAVEKQLNGCYTHLSRVLLNFKWRHHQSNQEGCCIMPWVTEKIRRQRSKLAGCCLRNKEKIALELVLRVPSHSWRNRGKPTFSITGLL